MVFFNTQQFHSSVMNGVNNPKKLTKEDEND